MRKTYTTDLSDAEWACLKDHLPASKLPGKMRTHALREIFDAIFYVLKSGCPLAASARRLSALADGLLPFPSIPPEWTVASHLHDPARGGEEKERQRP
jgi:hypothetical protein